MSDSNKIRFGSIDYLKAIYDMSDEQATAEQAIIKEAFQYLTDHPVICSGDWEEWGSQLTRNVSIGNLPYQVVRTMYFMYKNWLEVQEIAAGN